ncbi:MAG: restriction endonuclease [Anaerolineae bacterium]
MTAVRVESRFYQRVAEVRQQVTHPRRPSPRWAWMVAGGLTFAFVLWVLLRTLIQPAWISRLHGPLLELLRLGETATAVTLLVLWLALGWWAHRRHRTAVPTLSVEQLYALSPTAFEQYVAGIFRRKGYVVKHRGRSGDHGVDLELMQTSGKQAIVQCKRYRTTIGPEIVRELYGTMIHERVFHAFLVTTADISASSREWAQGKPMTLIDGRTLVQIAATQTESHIKRNVNRHV